MLESVDIRRTSEINSVFGSIFVKNEDSPYGYSYSQGNAFVVGLFALLSFGYMTPWVVIGSLIKFFTGEYGENFFVILNIAFYGVGYPVSYLQRSLDIYYETLYGSKFTFRRRIEFCFVCLLICTLCLSVASMIGYIIIVMFIGIFTWSSHGSVSVLASLVKNNSNISQQTGFALPGVFALIIHLAIPLHADSDSNGVFVFYGLSSVIVLIGLIAWIILGRSEVFRLLLEAKDDIIKHRVHGLINYRKSTRSTKVNFEDSDNVNASTSSMTNADILEMPLLSESEYYHDALIQAVLENPSLLSDALSSPQLMDSMRPYCRTLFLNIFCSVLQGSFLGFTPSDHSSSFSVVVALYYVRLFLDLVGRPLALFPRPFFLKTISGLKWAVVFRFFLMLFFFVYICVPSDRLFRNDMVIIGFQCVFSALSGYINALTYEYAAANFSEEWTRLQGAQILSVTFQQACLAAVCTATAIVVVRKLVFPDH